MLLVVRRAPADSRHMRRILLVLALLAVLLIPTPAAASTNLVRNPGWESGSHPWLVLGGTLATEGARTGTTAARLTGGEGTFEQTVNDLTPSTTYTLRGWARTDSQGVWIGVKRYGGTETNVRITSPQYTRGEVTFTTGSTNDSAVIYFFKNDSGNTAYGDDFELVPTATLGREHSRNGGFESGSDNWDRKNSNVVAHNARSGTNAAQLSGGEGTFEQTLTGLSANTTYVLTGWGKTDSADVWIGVKNYGGTETNQKITSSAYTKATVTFTTGRANTTALIYFFKFSIGNTGYGDDFSVQPASGTLPQLWTESALTSVFPGSGRSGTAGTGVSLLAARNEYESAQVVLRSPGTFTVNSVELPALASTSHQIPATDLRYRFVGNIHLPHNSSGIVGPVANAPGLFPEYLHNDTHRTVPSNTTQSISLTVRVPKETPAGIYRGTARVLTSAGTLTVPVQVEVVNVTVPDPDNSALSYSNYTYMFGFENSADDIERIYNLKKYSTGWWALMEKFAADLKEHRINTQWVPTMDLLLNGGSTVQPNGEIDFRWERFDEVVSFLISRGVAQRLLSENVLAKDGDSYRIWGLRRSGDRTVIDRIGYDTAEGKAFVAKYLDALREHLTAKGWYSRWTMNLGDEPWTNDQLDTMRRVYDEQLAPRMPGVRVSSPHAELRPETKTTYAGRVKILVPLLSVYEDNQTFYQTRKAAGDEIWTYICVLPQGEYYNRFIDLPAARLRLMNWYNFGQGVTGTLHWAYNNWHEPQTGISTPGDVAIVYPDPEHGTIMGSLRHDTMRDGAEDYELLALLAKRDPAAARALTTALAPTAKYQPVDPATFAAKRAELLHAAAS
ncbi:hypothetical protein GCM10029976_095250 [Kribbella albertanoniae]|uniref:DUF4091 domain-containing protein n=2 Tax=Kribbella albertanoniae TaxID=1266829 RepID=A0A4R4PX42_9ACTN|nr:DUF4091 domain-containing protein [Kribbella albertanoniae]